MIPQALELLHTTEAYQAEAVRLMMEEANFFADRLGLNEKVSRDCLQKPNESQVSPPPQGVGGFVKSLNYFFHFHDGRLRSVQKENWIQKINPPIQHFSDLADRPSLDSDGTYQLAIQRLAALGIDLKELASQFAPQIFQIPGRRHDAQGRHLRDPVNLVMIPVFEIAWGDTRKETVLPSGIKIQRPRRQPDRNAPVFIKILGTTQEIIELHLGDHSLLKRPALKIDRAADLLGPIPSARHFVEQLFGGKTAYETIENPDDAEACLLWQDFAAGGIYRDRPDSKRLTAEQAAQLAATLLDFDTYDWGLSGWMNGCLVEFGVRIKFIKDRDTVEMRFCFTCNILEIVHKNHSRGEDFRHGRNALVMTIQSVFPEDQIIKNLR
jgi:hypothetical protein